MSSRTGQIRKFKTPELCQTEIDEVIRNNTDEEETSLDLHLNRSHAKYVYDLLVDGSKNLNI